MLCQLCHAPVNFSVCPTCGLKTTDSPEVYPLRFGKHKGSTIEQVYTTEPSYLKWMVNNQVGLPAQRAQARLYLNRKIAPVYSSSQAVILKTESQNSGNTTGWIIAAVVAVVIAFAVISNQNKTTTTTSSPAEVQPPAATATAAVTQETPQQLSREGRLMYEAAGCEIKGNVGFNTGEKIYHVPGQRYYNATVINTNYGERWFCAEQDAANNGWRKSEL
jgi:hypothetical protein